jgi:pyruvate/2-oxoglutarate dehydrogenase complex dihydrolipoamide dehydrogenase (E3) component
VAVEHFDAIVIGSGQGGTPLAKDLAGAGRKTALVEREHVGGTCLNVGCTPTKTMIASARVAYLARRGGDYGVRTGPVEVDLRRVRERKRDIVADWTGASRRGLESTAGLELIMGEARFTGPKALDVAVNGGGVRQLAAERIFIDTGTRPAMPDLPGLKAVPTLDSTSIMELDKVPAHLMILGGGYVGLEFGQMFRRFGSAVTVVERGSQLLDGEDQDVADAVAEVLRQDGIEVLLNADAVRARKAGERVELVVHAGGEERTIAGSHLLVATGRVPNTERLNLPAAGVETDDNGFVKVDDRLQTNVAGIYALGDVNGGPAFTHISYNDYLIVKTNLLDGGSASTTGRPVPYVVYIDPQLGRVGLNETEAKAQGRAYRVAKMPMADVARAAETDETRGFMKVLVDPQTKRILGCAVLGVQGGELMAMLQLAMMGNIPYPALTEAVIAHPSLAESLTSVFDYLPDE